MISCTDFIPAYSELFKYLERRGGPEMVDAYWQMLAGNCDDTKLGRLVREKGLWGCWEYWDKNLNEEAAEFTMTLDEEAGVFTIDMHKCPSKGRFLREDCQHITPYPRYCDHCTLYKDSVESVGYEYHYDFSNVDRAACSIKIIDPSKQ